jgi:hypothetical protein
MQIHGVLICFLWDILILQELSWVSPTTKTDEEQQLIN